MMRADKWGQKQGSGCQLEGSTRQVRACRGENEAQDAMWRQENANSSRTSATGTTEANEIEPTQTRTLRKLQYGLFHVRRASGPTSSK